MTRIETLQLQLADMQYAPLDVERDAAECGYALDAEQIGLVHILDGDHRVVAAALVRRGGGRGCGGGGEW
jgi:hypothetical protein